MNQETTLQKQLIDQLEIYKLLYNDLLVKNNTLHRNNQKLLSGNNVINNEQNLVRNITNKTYKPVNTKLDIFSYISSVIDATKYI